MTISPDTKVAALLDEYPALEDTLIAMSPEFAKLRNPALRSTIAKIANLRQVAQMGDIPIATLVNHLRQAAGVEEEFDGDTASAPDDGVPAWVRNGAVEVRYDARMDLAAGMHPAQRVVSELGQLQPGSLYELVTPFVPAPLVDMARAKGFEAYSIKESDNEVRTLFRQLP